MKVLLTQDVKGKGKAGDIINANDGYARNFLIPRGLAVAADANNIHAANLKKQADVHRREVARQNARALADEMKGLTVKVYAKAGSGKLFGTVPAVDAGVGRRLYHAVRHHRPGEGVAVATGAYHRIH